MGYDNQGHAFPDQATEDWRMLETMASYGYLYVFLVSFLAATVIPLGSEWLLAALLVQAYDPFALVLVATAGNVTGAMTTYLVGVYGGEWLICFVLRMSAKSREKAEGIYRRYGSWSLLLSWVPIIGDPLCLIGGMFKLEFLRFTILVTMGKLARYCVVAWITLGLIR